MILRGRVGFRKKWGSETRATLTAWGTGEGDLGVFGGGMGRVGTGEAPPVQREPKRGPKAKGVLGLKRRDRPSGVGPLPGRHWAPPITTCGLSAAISVWLAHRHLSCLCWAQPESM